MRPGPSLYSTFDLLRAHIRNGAVGDGVSEIASLRANLEAKEGTCLETVTGIYIAPRAWRRA
jgi:hypothetical protein